MDNINLISVIIATHSRCESLKQTLESFLNQQCDGRFDYEIIIVGNNSKAETEHLVKSYFSKFNGRLKFLFEPIKGKAYALNKGIKASKGGIIAFTDDDCMPENRWLEKIYTHFKENEGLDMILGGAVFEDNSPFYKTSSLLRGNGLNLSFRREIIEDLGSFDNFFGPGSLGCSAEDTDLVYRFKKANKNIVILEDIKVVHKMRESNEETIKYAYRDSKALIIFWLKHVLKERDSFAIKNICRFFLDTTSKMLKEIKNKKRLILKTVQFSGGIVGLVKGACIWLIIEPIDRLCQK